MVSREDWGEMKKLLIPYSNEFLRDLCYILDLPISAPNKNTRIQKILDSEYSYEFVFNRFNFLDFGIDLLNYYNGRDIRKLRDEFNLTKHSKNRDNMVEIINSEIVTPRVLLGPLSDDQLESILDNFENITYGESIPEMIMAIIQEYQLDWMEEIMDQGFIVMPISKDPELIKIYEIIKEEASYFDINAIRIDELHTSGKITDEILEEIQKSKYFFVDLTNNRPNVYYELGYIHGLQKDKKNIILMAKKGTKTHFDIRNMRTIKYESPKQLKKILSKWIKAMVE